MSTELLTVEVDSDIKRRADAVFNELGMSAGNAVNLLLNHVAVQKRIPKDFEQPPIPCLEDMTEEEFDAMIQEAFDEIEAGEVIPAEEVRRMMESKYGIEI